MDVVLRAIFLFVFVWAITRAVGRRELSTLEPFDLILLIVLGDLIQQGVTQNDFSVTGAMLAAGTIGLMTIFFSWVNFRSSRAGDFLEGDPVIVVERGKPIDRNLRRNRITHEELAALPERGRRRRAAHAGRRARCRRRLLPAHVARSGREPAADALPRRGRRVCGHGRSRRRASPRGSQGVHVAVRRDGVRRRPLRSRASRPCRRDRGRQAGPAPNRSRERRRRSPASARRARRSSA